MFFFLQPAAILMVIYVSAALLPAIFLMYYIYRHDTVEKEPLPLLLSLILRGIAAALAAGILESIGEKLLGIFVSEESRGFVVCFAFLVVSAVEEGAKFLLLFRRTWSNPNFNCRFDGIVYAAFVSLGFAGFENLLYIFRYGLSVALPRAVLAIPGHLGFSVFMGYFYSRAKQWFDAGISHRARLYLTMAYLVPVLLHGMYDTCCMIGSGVSTAVFLLFVAAMYILVIRLIRRESAEDRFI